MILVKSLVLSGHSFPLLLGPLFSLLQALNKQISAEGLVNLAVVLTTYMLDIVIPFNFSNVISKDLI